MLQTERESSHFPDSLYFFATICLKAAREGERVGL